MTLELNYDVWDIKGTSRQLSELYYQSELPDNINLENEDRELEHELWMNFAFEKEWKSKRNLQFSITIGGENEDNFRQSDVVDSSMPMALQQFLQFSNVEESQRYYQGNFDFKTPFFQFGKIEAGFKADFIHYNIFQEVQLHAASIPDNEFSMDMQKLGVYLLQQHKTNKLEYGIGIRLEQFSSTAIQLADQNTFSQEYLRLFPSVQLKYLMPGPNQSIGLNYTRRINRPGFFDLNPYISFEDPLNLQTGNPALLPEIANLYEVNYHRGSDKLTLDFTLYQRETIGVIFSTIQSLGDNQTLSKPVNYSRAINRGLEGHLEFRPIESLKLNANFVWNQVAISDPEHLVFFDKPESWQLQCRQQLKLKSNWNLELKQSYRAPEYEAQLRRSEIFYLDFGILKKFENGRGSLSLNLRDVFNTRRDLELLQAPGFELSSRYKWQTRRLILGFRYLIFKS